MRRHSLLGLLSPGLLSLALHACAPGPGAEPHASGAPIGRAAQGLTSSLWGEAGEAFDPRGRLMDWSYAGYHAGEDPLPEPPVVATVTDFGAAADGSTDDGAAFEAAIAAAQAMVGTGGGTGGVAVRVPPGRYLVGRRLILPGGVALVGDGRDEVTLYFPEPLEALYPGERDWSFGGGFLQSSGSSSLPELTTVTAPAARGDTQITVADAAGIAPGDWIFVRQTDVGGALMRRLHADLVDGGSDNVGDPGMRFPTRVAAVEGNLVTLERALPVDVDMAWSPTVFSAQPRLSEVGVGGLTIEFPHTAYPGHFNELGYNAVHFNHAWHSWVRDLRVINADYGVSFTNSFFCTAQGVILSTSASRGADNGHHGLNNGHGGDNLFVDFEVRTTFVHDATNEWYAHGVVFTRGRGDNLSMDHHRAAPYTTLWTEIHAGRGTQPFRSGGSANRGPHTAAYDTLWNVTADAPMRFPAGDYGPRMNYIGFLTEESLPADHLDWYLEAIPPESLEPPNLWEAMRARRLGPPPGGEDAGVGGDSGPATDAGPPGDAGPRADAGARSDAGGGPGDPGGCGCRIDGRGGSRGGPSLLGLALLLGIALRRRNNSINQSI